MGFSELDADIAKDDLDAIRGVKNDLERLVKRIEQYVASGTLSAVDKALLPYRAVEMEDALNKILALDWDRASMQAGSNEALPSSSRYVAIMDRPPLRIPTNPATLAAIGTAE